MVKNFLLPTKRPGFDSWMHQLVNFNDHSLNVKRRGKAEDVGRIPIDC